MMLSIHAEPSHRVTEDHYVENVTWVKVEKDSERDYYFVRYDTKDNDIRSVTNVKSVLLTDYANNTLQYWKVVD